MGEFWARELAIADEIMAPVANPAIPQAALLLIPTPIIVMPTASVMPTAVMSPSVMVASLHWHDSCQS
ncbi:MAG: hypothetical protein CMJ28_02660 [Phycisphaerae bacterium]|nr:hypothetical protein [Phycisphaerae bacterium]